MRKIEYLSPTSISMFYTDQKEFYLNYLCSERPPRAPQTLPMGVGSSFDAHIKSYLHQALFGKNNDPKYDLDALFVAQCEEHTRDYCRAAGKYVFDCYQKSGAVADLLLELSEAIGKPRFEIEIKGVVEGYRAGVTRDIGGVVLLGKPDLFFINKHGASVILDWKCNGFLGTYTTSPMKGYVRLRGPGAIMGKQHKESFPMNHKGVIINAAHYLETLNMGWAQQLSIYAWLLGCNVGDDYIVAIDQIACDGTKRNQQNYPEIRIAEHRLRVSADFQYNTFAKCQEVWELVHSDHFFRDLSKEESIKQCQILDDVAKTMNASDDEMDKWLLNASRR